MANACIEIEPTIKDWKIPASLRSLVTAVIEGNVEILPVLATDQKTGPKRVSKRGQYIQWSRELRGI